MLTLMAIMAREDGHKNRGAGRTVSLRMVLATALAVLLTAAVPAAVAASGATGTGVQAGASCPATGAPKDGDVNGDGVDDWKLHEQDHANGTVEVWCVDANPADGQPAYFAVVWVDEEGNRHFVGKCPFGGGDNGGAKAVDDDGNLVHLTWVSVDDENDDDGDGEVDDAVYRYYPANNTVVVGHSENGTIVENRTRTPEEPPFDFEDLPPEDPTDEDFFAVAERPVGELPGEMVLSAESRDLTVTVRDEATGEPLGGTTVAVRTTDGEPVEALVTSERGTAATSLPAGEYVLDVEGAAPRVVDLTFFSHELAVTANATSSGDRVARLAERVDNLESANEDLKGDLEGLRSENDALSERVDRLERDNARLQENVSVLESEVAALRERPAGITIPGFGLPVAVAALVVAAALVRRGSVGRSGR